MGTKYSSNATSGYNSTPPADDGTVSEANKVKYSTIKTKLADPIKTLADTINSELATHFDNGPNNYTSNQTLGTSHYNQVNQVSGSGVTLSLTAATTLAAGWYTDIVSTDTTNSVTLARLAASDMINETSSDVTILPLQQLRVIVNAAANGFLISESARATKKHRIGEETQLISKSLWFAEGADVASASDCNVWSVADGNTVHITGTETITDWGAAPQAGAVMFLIFDDAVPLTYNATTNKLNTGGSNYTTEAGDRAIVYAESTSSYVVTIIPVAQRGAMGSSLVWLETITGSAVATLSSSAIMTSTYDEYWFVCHELVPATDGDPLWLRIGTGATPTFQAGANDYQTNLEAWLTNGVNDEYASGSAGTGRIELTADAAGYGVDASATSEGWSGTIKIIKPSGTSRFKSIIFDGMYQINDANSNSARVTGIGKYITATTALTGIRILAASGNITGTVYVYGLRKT